MPRKPDPKRETVEIVSAHVAWLRSRAATLGLDAGDIAAEAGVHVSKVKKALAGPYSDAVIDHLKIMDAILRPRGDVGPSVDTTYHASTSAASESDKVAFEIVQRIWKEGRAGESGERVTAAARSAEADRDADAAAKAAEDPLEVGYEVSPMNPARLPPRGRVRPKGARPAK